VPHGSRIYGPRRLIHIKAGPRLGFTQQ